MMRQRLMLLAVLLVPFVAGAQVPIAFAGMRWGMPQDSVKKVMIARGYHFDKIDEDGDLDFSGDVMDRHARLYAMMYEGRLVKVQISIPAETRHSREVWDAVKSQLTEKYGTPRDDKVLFESPYEAGDGYESTAIAVGKAHFFADWVQEALGGEAALWMEVTEHGTVTMHYESPKWAVAVAERRRKRARDF